jgi:biotin synthase-like enzyme
MKPKTRIRITGTRTGKLRARVEQEIEFGFNAPFVGQRFEVTIGGEKWATLSTELREKIIARAHAYMQKLSDDLDTTHGRLADDIMDERRTA